MKSKAFAFVVVLFACMPFKGFAQSSFVVYGQLRAIMQQGDLSAKVSLDTMKLVPGAMGLGVVEGLKGEIIVLDGEAHTSSLHGEVIENNVGNDLKAAMLVVINEDSPKGEFEIAGVNSIRHLEEIIADNLDNTAPGTGQLAFWIDADKADINYHIIDWKDGVAHTPENHKQFAIRGELKGEKVTIIGFFSEKGAGIFTPHTSKVHLHVYSPSKRIVGHVDEIMLHGIVGIRYY